MLRSIVAAHPCVHEKLRNMAQKIPASTDISHPTTKHPRVRGYLVAYNLYCPLLTVDRDAKTHSKKHDAQIPLAVGIRSACRVICRANENIKLHLYYYSYFLILQNLKFHFVLVVLIIVSSDYNSNSRLYCNYCIKSNVF